MFVSDLLERAPAGAVRLALLGHHYRHDWTWTDGDLDRWRSGGSRRTRSGTGEPTRRGLLDDVRAALDDDLDAPAALAAIDAAPRGTDVSPALALLGVTL